MEMRKIHGNLLRRVSKASCIALAIGFILWNAAVPQQAASDSYEAARANADRQAKEWIARGIPGLSLTVAVDGKIMYSEGFGYADLEERVPVWPTTKFRIGSISKPLTATALMQLVEAGKLELDAPVQKYVPSLPEKGAVITTRMLAGHLAGIRHYQGDEFNIQRHYANVLDGVNIFENDPLVSPPGTKFNYSSYGYNLLSAVVESAFRNPGCSSIDPNRTRSSEVDKNPPPAHL